MYYCQCGPAYDANRGAIRQSRESGSLLGAACHAEHAPIYIGGMYGVAHSLGIKSERKGVAERFSDEALRSKIGGQGLSCIPRSLNPFVPPVSEVPESHNKQVCLLSPLYFTYHCLSFFAACRFSYLLRHGRNEAKVHEASWASLCVCLFNKIKRETN